MFDHHEGISVKQYACIYTRYNTIYLFQTAVIYIKHMYIYHDILKQQFVVTDFLNISFGLAEYKTMVLNLVPNLSTHEDRFLIEPLVL